MDTVLMPASEALRSVPSARLTDDEHAQVEEILKEIDVGIRTQMKRNGFQYQTRNRNPAVAFEVVQRLTDAGYDVQAAPLVHPTRRGLDGQLEALGFRFGCCPSHEAVVAARVPEPRGGGEAPVLGCATMSGAGEPGVRFYLSQPDGPAVELRQVAFWSDAAGAKHYFKPYEDSPRNASTTPPATVSE